MSNSKQDKAFSELIEGYVNTTIADAALDSAIDFIANEFDPDDIFDEKTLSKWAESNGYVKEEK